MWELLELLKECVGAAGWKDPAEKVLQQWVQLQETDKEQELDELSLQERAAGDSFSPAVWERHLTQYEEYVWERHQAQIAMHLQQLLSSFGREAAENRKEPLQQLQEEKANRQRQQQLGEAGPLPDYLQLPLGHLSPQHLSLLLLLLQQEKLQQLSLLQEEKKIAAAAASPRLHSQLVGSLLADSLLVGSPLAADPFLRVTLPTLGLNRGLDTPINCRACSGSASHGLTPSTASVHQSSSSAAQQQQQLFTAATAPHL